MTTRHRLLRRARTGSLAIATIWLALLAPQEAIASSPAERSAPSPTSDEAEQINAAVEQSVLYYVELHRGQGQARIINRDERYTVSTPGRPDRPASYYQVEDDGGSLGVAAIGLDPAGELIDIQLFEPDPLDSQERRLTVYTAAFDAGEGFFKTLKGKPVDNERGVSKPMTRQNANKPSSDIETQVLITICELYAWSPYLSSGYAVGAAEISFCNYAADLRLRIWLQRSYYSSGPWVVKSYLDQWHYGVYFYRNALSQCGSSTYYYWKTQVIGEAYWPNGHDAAVIHTPMRFLPCW